MKIFKNTRWRILQQVYNKEYINNSDNIIIFSIYFNTIVIMIKEKCYFQSTGNTTINNLTVDLKLVILPLSPNLQLHVNSIDVFINIFNNI